MSSIKTRRQSKAAGGASDCLAVTIPDDIDTDELSNLLPAMTLDSPTADTILALYRLVIDQAVDIESKQHSLDEARAEAEKKDVELDQALQDRETLSSELETQIQALQDELKELKSEKDLLLSSKADLQTQIARISSSSSASSSELDNMKHRVQDAEREKRDLLGVVSRLKQDEAQRDDEIQTLRKNLKEARHEHQELENQLREFRSTDTSSKFKLDSMTQQLSLAQTEVERVNAELITKSEEFTKFRRAKQAELATLQANYDATTQGNDSAQASLKALQSSHSAQTHQLTQALTKVHDLTAQLAEQDAVFNNEVNGLRRLVSLLEVREKQAKDIVDSIEKDWNDFHDQADREINALKTELEREKKGREEAQKKLDHLQTVLEKMGQGELPAPGRLPGTPLRHGAMDESMDGMMNLSPAIAIASRAQKTGKTFTEVYADYVRLQEEYSKKCTEYDHMDRTLTQVLAQIEERAPIISQQRSEYERLQSEAIQLASQLAQAISDRDSQATLALENSQKFTKAKREGELLQQQLEDLGRQVQNLLREIGRRDDPSLPADEDLGNVPQVVMADNVDSIITNNLVLFKSINGLQEQNQKLLQVIRQLGQKMETEEKEYREAMEREQGEAVKEAHDVIQDLASQLDRQKKSSDAIIQTYVKERDALKSVISRLESAGGHSGINGHSSGSTPEISKDLAEIQTQFDTYRAEMGVDSGRIREDLVLAQKEIAKLQADVAKEKARSDYYSERIRIKQEEYSLRAQDLEDATKRNQTLFDQWTRADIECGRLSEDLRVAAGTIEKLRNDAANLRAEKQIWEGVQTRLMDENKTLALERSHLSDMMTNIQKMNNDNQRSGESDRRRLESQLQLLEGQIQDNRAQLSEERDNVRHVTLQKEIESRDLQSRLDKASQDLAKTRENLVGAETSKKHLEQRVEDLTKYFESNKEKLAVYERRGSTATPVGSSLDASKEQQLESEVAELSASLKAAERDLEKAKERVAQYEGIARAAEEALGQLNATYDQYKLSTDSTIAKHESTIQGLDDKLTASVQELARLTQSLSDIQKTLDTERTAWNKDKNELEGTIIELSTSGKSSENDRTARESEVRAQEERTRAAEERYKLEVVAHADSIKAVTQLREQVNSLQASVRDNSVAAETAIAKLAASEQSWTQQREILDKEIAEHNKRYKDLQARNKDLLLQFEDATKQAARLAAGAPGEAAAIEAGQVPEKVVEFYRDQNTYLEVQLETKQAETARLKAQADHLNRELDEMRTILTQERERAVESAGSATQHSELVKKIEQLNILRESNATLRAEADRHSKRVKQLELQLKDATSLLEPTTEQVRLAQAELDAGKAHITRLENESRHWQERNTQLLTKYDRIEVQALQDEITQLKTDKEVLEKEVTDLRKYGESLKERYSKFRAAHDRYKTAATTLETEKVAWLAEKAAYEQTRTELDGKIATLEIEIETLRVSKQAETSNVETQNAENCKKMSEQNEAMSKLKNQVMQLTRERDRLKTEHAAALSAQTSSPAAAATTSDEATALLWEAEKNALIKERDDALEKVTELEKKLAEVEEDLVSSKNGLAKLTTRLTDAARRENAVRENALKEQEAAVQAALDALREELQASSSSAAGGDEDTNKKHIEEIEKLKAEIHSAHTAEVAQLKAVFEEQIKAAKVPGTVTEEDHQKAIKEALQRGEKEASLKSRLKDNTIVQRSNALKKLEVQREWWIKQGWLTEEQAQSEPPIVTSSLATATTPSTTPIASTSAAAVKPALSTTAAPFKPGTASTSAAAAPKKLPDTALGSGPVAAATRGASAGRGRGASPAGQAARGGAAARGRGGAARGGAATKTNGAPAAQGPSLSVLGASGKRPRDSEVGEDPSAKRPKPAGGPSKVINRLPPTKPPAPS